MMVMETVLCRKQYGEGRRGVEWSANIYAIRKLTKERTPPNSDNQ